MENTNSDTTDKPITLWATTDRSTEKLSEEEVPHIVTQTKQFRKDLDAILQRMLKAETDRESRERVLSYTKLQEAILWLGMDLKAMREEGVAGCANPYPQSYNPASAVIEKPADGLKM